MKNKYMSIPGEVYEAHFGGDIQVAPGFLLIQEMVRVFDVSVFEKFNGLVADFNNAVTPDDHVVRVLREKEDESGWTLGLELKNGTKIMSFDLLEEFKLDCPTFPVFCEKFPEPISREKILETILHKEPICMLDQIVGKAGNGIVAEASINRDTIFIGYSNIHWYFYFMEMIGQLGCFYLLGGYAEGVKVGKMTGYRYPIFTKVEIDYSGCKGLKPSPGQKVDVFLFSTGAKRQACGAIGLNDRVIFRMKFNYMLLGARRMKSLINSGRERIIPDDKE